MTDEHIASVFDDYRVYRTWAARCSCGWEEMHTLSVVADRAAENHMRRPTPATPPRPERGRED